MDQRAGFGSNGSASNNSDDILAFMEQMGIADPRLPLILEFMRQRAPQSPESVASREQPAKLKRVIAKYRQLKQEHSLLQARNDMLAAALGACPQCWGEDEGCPMCRGRGLAGTYRPDKDAFAVYVLPLVRKIRWVERAERSGSADVDLARETTIKNGR